MIEDDVKYFPDALKQLGAAVIEQAVHDLDELPRAARRGLDSFGGKPKHVEALDAQKFIFDGDRLPRAIEVFGLNLNAQSMRQRIQENLASVNRPIVSAFGHNGRSFTPEEES